MFFGKKYQKRVFVGLSIAGVCSAVCIFNCGFQSKVITDHLRLRLRRNLVISMPQLETVRLRKAEKRPGRNQKLEDTAVMKVRRLV